MKYKRKKQGCVASGHSPLFYSDQISAQYHANFSLFTLVIAQCHTNLFPYLLTVALCHANLFPYSLTVAQCHTNLFPCLLWLLHSVMPIYFLIYSDYCSAMPIYFLIYSGYCTVPCQFISLFTLLQCHTNLFPYLLWLLHSAMLIYFLIYSIAVPCQFISLFTLTITVPCQFPYLLWLLQCHANLFPCETLTVAQCHAHFFSYCGQTSLFKLCHHLVKFQYFPFLFSKDVFAHCTNIIVDRGDWYPNISNILIYKYMSNIFGKS